MNWSILIEIIIILLVAVAVNVLFARLIGTITRKEYIPDTLEPVLLGFAKWFIVICAVMLALRVFGIPLSQVLTAASALLMVIAIGFVALWSVLSNMLCAFLLLTFPAFLFGDVIELREPEKENGIKGKVVNLNLFHTTLRSTTDGDSCFIRIPNTLFFQRVVFCHENTNTSKLKFGAIDESEDVTEVKDS